jgi:putative restriction endonuclease
MRERASKAKGIYKPQWTDYALSVRQNLNGPYPDREPIWRPDGTWLYSYFQEGEDPEGRDKAYTNRGLIACWQDTVPIGVLRQVKGKPRPLYQVLGLAIVAGWDGGYFSLEGFSKNGHSRDRGPEAEIEALTALQPEASQATQAFNPESLIDGRERTVASIVRRRGQPAFRRKLIEVYESRCAISGCDAAEALEAAHIVPYLGPETNHPSNGILLRGDIHTLFDLGLLTVDPSNMTVIVAPRLQQTSYATLDGKPLFLPKYVDARPSVVALARHRTWSGL